MARPTTWRRSWGFDQGAVGVARHMNLLSLVPGETLGGVWWTYKVHAGPFTTTTYTPENSLTFMGLQLYDDATGPLDPLVNASGDWLWWELVAWFSTMSASVDLNIAHEAWGPRTERKAEAMRKAPVANNATLAVSTRTDQQLASNGFVNGQRFEVAVSALIILP